MLRPECAGPLTTRLHTIRVRAIDVAEDPCRYRGRRLYMIGTRNECKGVSLLSMAPRRMGASLCASGIECSRRCRKAASENARLCGRDGTAGTLEFMRSVPTARARPVAVVEGLDDAAPERDTVRLPRHIRWSGVPIDYDLGDPRDLRSVYEQVLREGDANDVRRYIRASALVDVWDDLYLPAYVRAAWEPWIRSRRARRTA